jgi:hypothetical protein
MEHKPSVGPRDFFLWTAATIALYVSVISLLALWFEFIDRLWGEASQYMYDPYSAGIRIAVASLVIVFPLYVYFMRKLHEDIRIARERKELWVRKWLLGFTLFIAAFTIVVDLIVLINAFLGGEELTTSFILKVASVLVVVGGAFMYYLHEVRGTWEWKKELSQWIAAGVSVIIAASVIAAFYFIGSPQTQRFMRYDQQKVSDLQSIQWQVTDYWQQKQKLPASLNELEDPLRGMTIPQDPQAKEGQMYEYAAKDKDTFELCATFNLATPARTVEDASPDVSYPTPTPADEKYWKHDTGRACFERTIDPDKFPPYSKGM